MISHSFFGKNRRFSKDEYNIEINQGCKYFPKLAIQIQNIS